MDQTLHSFSCDVDGILNDYPLCWLRYLADKCGTLYETVSLAKQNEINYKHYKDEYRNSSFKANLPVLRRNRDTIRKIISRGYNPIMVTSRPILDDKYPGLFDRTLQWLKKTELPFSEFKYKDPAASFLDSCHKIHFHIDDDPIYAKIVALKGVKVFLLRNDNWDFSIIKESKNIIIINDLMEILEDESIF